MAWSGTGETSGDILYREISFKDFVQEVKSIMAGAVGMGSGSPGSPEVQREFNSAIRELSLRIERKRLITLPEIHTEDKYLLPIAILRVDRVIVNDVEVPIANCSYPEWLTDLYRAKVDDDVYIGEDRYLRFREDITEDDEVKLSITCFYEPSTTVESTELFYMPYMFYDAIKSYIISNLYLYARYMNPELYAVWKNKYDKLVAQIVSHQLAEQTFIYGTL